MKIPSLNQKRKWPNKPSKRDWGHFWPRSTWLNITKQNVENVDSSETIYRKLEISCWNTSYVGECPSRIRSSTCTGYFLNLKLTYALYHAVFLCKLKTNIHSCTSTSTKRDTMFAPIIYMYMYNSPFWVTCMYRYPRLVVIVSIVL